MIIRYKYSNNDSNNDNKYIVIISDNDHKNDNK